MQGESVQQTEPMSGVGQEWNWLIDWLIDGWNDGMIGVGGAMQVKFVHGFDKFLAVTRRIFVVPMAGDPQCFSIADAMSRQHM